MNWPIIIIGFCICVILKFIINLFKWHRIENLFQKYNESIFERKGDFRMYHQETKDLLKEAGLSDFVVFHTEMLGFGNVASATISGFDNMDSNRVDIVKNMDLKFREAIGVYRRRCMQSFNPVFWIELILKLPEFLLKFIGILPEKLVVKLALFLYWSLCIIWGLKKFEILDVLLK